MNNDEVCCHVLDVDSCLLAKVVALHCLRRLGHVLLYIQREHALQSLGPVTREGESPTVILNLEWNQLRTQ